jgi:uncharacterized protein with von Willebrand factor type A (vWA) domain
VDTVINDFVQVLRRHQLRVSPAESIDALHALGQVGLGEREVVRDTLRATLVKNGEDAGTFDHLFDLFFDMRPTAEKPRRRSRFPGTTTITARRPRGWSWARKRGARSRGKRATATTRTSPRRCAGSSKRTVCAPRTTSTATRRG